MKEQFKKFLNEEQDPKAVEKIASKMSDLLMKNEEIGYIGVQKKPAINVLPDSIILTNKRILICKPKNLGLSMSFIDYGWKDIAAVLVKENILGSEFSFSTHTDLSVSIDYLPKTQARRIYTYAKEQLEAVKENAIISEVSPVEKEEVKEAIVAEESVVVETEIVVIEEPFIEEMETEEVHHFAEIIDVEKYTIMQEPFVQNTENRTAASQEKALSEMSQDELIEKLKNFKKLLDNGLILQAEYDAKKNEIIAYM